MSERVRRIRISLLVNAGGTEKAHAGNGGAARCNGGARHIGGIDCEHTHGAQTGGNR